MRRKIEPKAFLLWVGDGELKNNVEKKLYDMGLERDVQFVGRKPNVQEWYSAMDLFFLPSVFEGMGIVFLEAQCTGLPCVGSSNVPIETEITELMHRISLKDNEKIWAIQMKKILDESINRKTRDKDFIDKEYTHDLTQNDLRDYYNYLLYKKEEN
ncbi:glycosyltransferase [Holdemanella biformis]